MIEPSRRSLIVGLGALFVCAPAIVRAGSLMPVKVIEEPLFRTISINGIPISFDTPVDPELVQLMERRMVDAAIALARNIRENLYGDHRCPDASITRNWN